MTESVLESRGATEIHMAESACSTGEAPTVRSPWPTAREQPLLMATREKPVQL